MPPVNANSIPLDRTDSWLSQLIKREICELQSRDERERVGRASKTQPQRCPPSACHVIKKSLWAQKKYLEVIDGVLLVPTVLAELHDSPAAGHLGVGKVLEMLVLVVPFNVPRKSGVHYA
eukprot:Em0024g74a